MANENKKHNRKRSGYGSFVETNAGYGYRIDYLILFYYNERRTNAMPLEIFHAYANWHEWHFGAIGSIEVLTKLHIDATISLSLSPPCRPCIGVSIHATEAAFFGCHWCCALACTSAYGIL